MPAIFKQAFTVRQYECDAYGHLNNVNYVRWMQEAALLASAAVGWNMARYADEGTQWVIRETHVEYLQALKYGDTVTITTWIDDFRKVRSLRRYEFHKEGTLVARATTDWVYMDVRNGRLATIGEAMVRDFRPEGDPPTQPRPKFPDAPPAPNEVFEQTKRVEWRDIDVQGHANNATYLAFIEDTFLQVGARYGWGVERLQAMGVATVVREWRVQYLQAAKLDDLITIRTFMSEPRRVSFQRHYELVRGSERVAQAVALCVFVDGVTGKPVRAPVGIMEDFAVNRSG
jgi:acyl-CoA thioester hydrolase